MNHYVNGITNLSMSDGVVTFKYVNVFNDEKGETRVENEVSISMPGNTFNNLMNLCADFVKKVNENAENQNNLKIEENSVNEETPPKKTRKSKKQ